VDDTLQIKGGRGYGLPDSLRSRGEKPDPVERLMRDMRINLIFEDRAGDHAALIARKAVDTHMRVAGDLIDPKVPAGQKVGALLGEPSTPSGIPSSGRRARVVRPREFGRLASHMRFVERSSRRLARSLFHVWCGSVPCLEKRQAVLGRLVEIGAELSRSPAACSRRMRCSEESPETGPRELADVFSQQARLRVEQKSHDHGNNTDTVTYTYARLLDDHSLAGRGNRPGVSLAERRCSVIND
jgi:hypothetical protein